MLFQLGFLCLCCTVLTFGAPLFAKKVTNYLTDYGYLDPEVTKPNSHISAAKKEIMLKEAVTEFQNFYRLPPTGKMDKVTNWAMQQPRCGEKDKLTPEEKHTREKRLIPSVARWTKRELTYTVNRYPRHVQLSREAVDEEMRLAFMAWSNLTDLSFKPVVGKADINISFFQGSHGDPKPFDGRGFVLGHACQPPCGMVHFDDEEWWTIRASGQNLFLVAVHEIGHALGLHHSEVQGSIMQGMLMRGYEPDFVMHIEDVKTIQNLYGEKKDRPADLCSDSSFDAIFQNPLGIIYVFKGKYYWTLGLDGFTSDSPSLISHQWPELPDDLDAALATSSGRTYFFKDKQYWAYQHTRLLPGHPKLISKEWPGIPDNIDGATWYKKNIFYFFKGEHYWIYNSDRSPSIQHNEPKLMSDWGNIITDGLDDVLHMRSDSIYFFNSGSYYRYNCRTKLVDPGWPSLPEYPRPVAQWWFRCTKKPDDDNEVDLYS